MWTKLNYLCVTFLCPFLIGCGGLPVNSSDLTVEGDKPSWSIVDCLSCKKSLSEDEGCEELNLAGDDSLVE